MVLPAFLQQGMARMPSRNDPSIDEELSLLQEEEDILTGKWQPSAGYGEIALKHAQNIPDVAKATGGTALQYLGEMGKYSPQLGLASLAANLFYAGKGGAAPVGAGIRQEAQQAMAENQPYIRPEETGKQYLSDVIRATEEMGPGLAASLATRSPLPMLGQAGVLGGAGSYAEQREAGRTPEQAAAAALPSAAAEVAFERLPIGILLKEGTPFLKRAIGSIVGEGVSESATEAVQAAIEAGTISPDMTLQDYLSRVGYAGAVGAGAGGAVSIPSQIADVARRPKAEPEGEFYVPDMDIQDEFSAAAEQLALPAPEERLGLAAPEQQLALPKPRAEAPFEGAPIIAGEEGARFQTLPEKQAEEAVLQRQIDLGQKDVARLSPAAIQKFKDARVKRLAREDKVAAREEAKTIKAEEKAKGAEERDTLFNFIAKTGGVKKDEAGDLVQSLGGVNPLIPGKGRMVREKGKSLDYVREAAVEEGLLPEDSTVDDLLQAIDREARGEPVRRPEAIIEPTQQDYINDLQVEADKMGISTEGKTPEALLTEMESQVQQQLEEEDPMLAVERMEAPQEAEEEIPDIPFDAPVTTKAVEVPIIKTEKVVEKPTAKIEDFGEKLEGAKKDLWKSYNEALQTELPEDLSKVTLSKYFPEPNYEKAIESGQDIESLVALKVIRNEIPNKPRKSWALKNWGQKVSTLKSLANDVVSGRYTVEQVKEKMRSNSILSELADRIELFSSLGYPAFTNATKDTRLWEQAGTWIAVTGKKKAYGYDMGQFDTKERGLEYLRTALAAKPKKSKATKLNIYRVNATGDIVIGKKVSSRQYIDLKTGFKNAKEAREYLNNNYDTLVDNLKQKRKMPETRRTQDAPRVGKDYRGGKDALPDLFQKEFGFRGVQFGNYVEQSRRVGDLNNAYDALLDMATLLNIPSETISLDGKLGLAFGARGKAGAKAHYEPDSKVINLTKTSGAGSLAHEWLHSLDNYFGTMLRGNNAMISDNPYYKQGSEVRPEVAEKFNDVVNAIENTELPARSKRLDQRKTKPYWNTKVEKLARAFESYLIHKAAQKNESNDYLANIIDEKSFQDIEADTYPYLTAEEITKVAPAFDELFAEMKVKKGESGRGTLYSGVDPSLISNLFGTKEERAEFYNGLKKVPSGLKSLGKNVGGIAGTGFLSIDDNLRIRSKIYNMPTIKKIADMLYGGTQDTYGEAVRSRQTINHNKVERILNPIRKSKKMLDETIRLIQNPKEIKIGRSPADNAAVGIARLLKAERQYMVDAGVEVGEIEGYFPRVYDLVKILQNEDAFLRAAKIAYRDTYPDMTSAEISEKAQGWLDNVKLNNAGVSVDGNDFQTRAGIPKPNSLKERTLSKKADAVMKQFLLQDPQEVLTQHFIQTAKRAEFERRFNIDEWKQLKADMVREAEASDKEGAHDAIRKTVADIMAATGNNVGNMPQGASDALAWVKMFGAMSMLPHAVLTALPETVMPALRAGDVRESFAGLTGAWRSLMKDSTWREQKEIAEEVIGVAAKAVSDMAAEQRMGGELGTATTNKLMAKFFTATGLHGFTEGMRVASTGVGMRYIANLAEDMSQNPKKTKLYMEDLGIDPKEAKDFAQWVLSHESGKVSAEVLRADSKYPNMYKRAVRRFVDQSVIKPEAAEKPRYASHKIGSLFYYLQSFIYGFQKNVILRQAKNVKRAATEEGLSVGNRAAMMAPLILTPIILGALQYGLGDLRDKVLDSETKKKMSPERKAARALSRTGYYGQLDPWINLFASLKYRREPATTLAGPVFGGLLDTFAALAALQIGNSKNTNTQERKAAQQIWRSFVKPSMMTMFTAMPGPLKAPLIQMMGHPQLEEEFIQAVAGKKRK